MKNNSNNLDASHVVLIIREEVQRALQGVAQGLQKKQEGFLTRKEACAFLKVGETTFNELRKDGIVKPVRLGRRTIYKKADLVDIESTLSLNYNNSAA